METHTQICLIQKSVLSLTGQESTQHGSFDMFLLSNLGKVPGYLRWRLPEGLNPVEKHHLLLRDQSNGAENDEIKRSVLIILNGCYYNNKMF